MILDVLPGRREELSSRLLSKHNSHYFSVFDSQGRFYSLVLDLRSMPDNGMYGGNVHILQPVRTQRGR